MFFVREDGSQAVDILGLTIMLCIW